MIHRAILGSLERFIAIITEHFGGKWCVFFRVFSNACVLRWAFRNAQAVLVVASPSARDSGRRPLCESCARSRIIPQQLTRTPFGACVRMQKEYAQEIADKLTALGLFADVDNGADTLPKKIRNGEIAQYNFLLGMFFFFVCLVIRRISSDMPRHVIFSRGPRRTRQSVGQRPKSGRRGHKGQGRDGTAGRGHCQAGRAQALAASRK